MFLKKPNHIKWGVFLTYFSLLINIVLSIAYTPIMLSILGQSEHGLYSTVSSVMSWLSLLGLGIGSSYIYYFARYNAKKDNMAIASLNGLFIIIFTIIGLICLLCGLYIASHLRYIFANGMTEAEYATAKKLAIIVTIDMSIGFPASVFSGVIRAYERYIQSKGIALFQNVCTPLLTLPLLLSGYGSVGMVVATTIIDCLAYSFNIIYCFRNIHMKICFSGVEHGVMVGIFNYSIFVALNSLITQFATGLDKLVITRYVNTAAVSVYAVGCSLYHYYAAFSSAISSVFTTRIQKITVEFIANKEQLKIRLTEQFIKLGRIQFLIQMLMLMWIIYFGRPFIHLWAERGGQNYRESYPIALLLCFSATVPLIQDIGIAVQRAQNKHKYRTLFYGIMTFMNVFLTIWLCKIIGPIGAAIGTAVSTLLMDVVVMNVFYHQYLYLDVPLFWRNILGMLKGLIPPAIIGYIVIKKIDIVTVPRLILTTLLYMIIYIISMWNLSMNTSEKELCTGWMRKSGKNYKSC